MSEYVTLTLVDQEKTYKFHTLKGKNLWETVQLSGGQIPGVCGGRGTCGKCKLKIEGERGPVKAEELKHLLPDEIKLGYCLACLHHITGPLTVYLEPGDREVKPGIRKSPIILARDFKPQLNVESISFFIPGLEKEAPIPMLTRIQKALPNCSIRILPPTLNKLNYLDRAGRPAIELFAVVYDQNEVRHITDKQKELFGLAIDLGSTTLFTALANLNQGETVAVRAMNNMQRVYGEDIISRISYCQDHHDGYKDLHQILVNNINSMIEAMLHEIVLCPQSIYKIVVVGNPVMLHFLLGLEVRGFAQSPYTGLFKGQFNMKAGEAGLQAHPLAELILLPQVGSFVGSDLVGSLVYLAEAMDEHSRFLFIDMGTNCEILLYNKGKMLAASAAAGPAFEGGAISCGMRMGPGAIERVTLENHTLIFNVLGEDKPRGLSGSAVIDLCACLLRNGTLEENGNITSDAHLDHDIKTTGAGNCIILVAGEEEQGPLFFTQEDVRQVQLAKAAIRTGIEMLLEQEGLSYKDLHQVFMAGTFGSYMDPQNTIAIGLLPPVPVDMIKNVGNSAAAGAMMALLSEEKRTQAVKIEEKVSHVELSLQRNFQEKYLAYLNFYNPVTE